MYISGLKTFFFTLIISISVKNVSLGNIEPVFEMEPGITT